MFDGLLIVLNNFCVTSYLVQASFDLNLSYTFHFYAAFQLRACMMQNIERHLTCNGFEAWVSVEGKLLTQYSEDYDESTRKNEVTCWIPSETNKVSLT